MNLIKVISSLLAPPKDQSEGATLEGNVDEMPDDLKTEQAAPPTTDVTEDD
jgi:hypothetical protein